MRRLAGHMVKLATVNHITRGCLIKKENEGKGVFYSLKPNFNKIIGWAGS